MPTSLFTFSSKKLFFAGRNLFWVLAWFVGWGLLLLHPLRWLSGDALKPVRAISYIIPWLLIFSLPMLFLAGWMRRKWLSLFLTIASVGIVLPFAPLFLPNRQMSLSPQEVSLKVMSYNLHGIQQIDGVVEVIRLEKPDILLIQECSAALVSPASRALDDLYPYMDVDPFSGQAVFSSYPVIRYSFAFDKGRTQQVRIQTPRVSIAVWNVHPIPPFLVSPEQYDAQMSALAADISEVKGPLIVAGDFNATQSSETYRAIRRLLKDAHWEAGWGFGFSYPAPPYTFMDTSLQTGPLWRIDYIFYSQEFTATDARTLRTSGGSDHFPVVAELSMIERK